MVHASTDRSVDSILTARLDYCNVRVITRIRSKVVGVPRKGFGAYGMAPESGALSCEQPRDGTRLVCGGREVGSDPRANNHRGTPGRGRAGGRAAVRFLHFRAHRGNRGADPLPPSEVSRSCVSGKDPMDVGNGVTPGERALARRVTSEVQMLHECGAVEPAWDEDSRHVPPGTRTAGDVGGMFA
jgi:hypothetical protein